MNFVFDLGRHRRLHCTVVQAINKKHELLEIPYLHKMSWLLKITTEETTDTDLLASQLWDLGTTGLYVETTQLVAGFETHNQAESAAKVIELPNKIERVSEIWSNPAQGVFKHKTSEGLLQLEISADKAFGHGHHATTRLALELMLNEIFMLSSSERTNINLLDLGTGSGILAIAAAKFGVDNVYAIDNQTEAIETARSNAEVNNANINVSSKTVEDLNTNFDLIVANVLLPVHQKLASQIVAALNSGARLITSGYLQSQSDKLNKSYETLQVEATEQLSGWQADVFKVS